MKKIIYIITLQLSIYGLVYGQCEYSFKLIPVNPIITVCQNKKTTLEVEILDYKSCDMKDRSYQWKKSTGMCGNNATIVDNGTDLTLDLYNSTAGTYYYYLVVTTKIDVNTTYYDSTGCFTVTVHANPTGTITIPSGIVCTRECKEFKIDNEGPSGATFSYKWNIPDVTYCTSYSDIKDPTQGSFTSNGDKKVNCKLSYMPTGGITCSTDLDEKTVSVYSKPDLTKITGETTVCDNLIYKYNTDCTNCNGMSYTWTIMPLQNGTFQNNTNSSSTEPEIKFSDNCTLKVTINNNNNCEVTKELMIMVYKSPTGSITGPSMTCQDIEREYKLSLPCSGCSFDWEIDPPNSGSFTTKNDQTFKVTWKQSGIQNKVKLKISNNGCTTIVQDYNVTVYDKPSGEIKGIQDLCINSIKQYSVDPVCNSCSSYTWNTDRGMGSSNTDKIDISWANEGMKTIRCTLTNINGCTNEAKTLDVKVTAPPSGGKLTNDKNNVICSQETVKFSVTTCPGCNYNWTIPNGLSTSQTYSQDSSQLTLTISDFTTTQMYDVSVQRSINGCLEGKLVNSVKVHPLPSGTIQAMDSVCQGEDLNFQFIPASSNYSYSWDNGEMKTYNGNNVNISWMDSGDKMIQCDVKNTSTMCTKTFYKKIYVKPLPSVEVSSNTPTKICEGTSFDNKVFKLDNQSCLNCTVKWTLDGNQLDGNYKFNEEGLKELVVNVTSQDGCIKEIKHNVTVYPKPSAIYDFKDEVCQYIPLQLKIKPDSAQNNFIYKWETGKSQELDDSTNARPTVRFSEAGNNNNYIRLTIYNKDFEACSTHLENKTIMVHPVPNGNLAADSTICQKLQGTYKAYDIKDCDSCKLEWFMDNMKQTQNDSIITKIWNDDGTKKVKLLLTTRHGCIDSIERIIVVNPKPSTPTQYLDTSFCNYKSGQTIIYKSGNDTLIYFWQGEERKTLAELNFSGASTGDYYIPLQHKSDKSCFSDVDTMIVTLNCLPNAQLQIGGAQDSICQNEVYFYDKSEECSLKNDSVEFRYSNNNQLVIEKFSKASSYKLKEITDINAGTTIGTKQILFTVINEKNCIDTVSKTIMLKYCNNECKLEATRNAKTCLGNDSELKIYPLTSQNLTDFKIDVSNIMINNKSKSNSRLQIKLNEQKDTIRLICSSDTTGVFDIEIPYTKTTCLAEGNQILKLTLTIFSPPYFDAKKVELKGCKGDQKEYKIADFIDFSKYGNGPNDEYSLSQGSIDYNKTILISFDSTKTLTFSELKNNYGCRSINPMIKIITQPLPEYKKHLETYCANDSTTIINFTNSLHNSTYKYQIVIDNDTLIEHNGSYNIQWKKRDTIPYKVYINDTLTGCTNAINNKLILGIDFERSKDLEYKVNANEPAEYCGDPKFMLIQIINLPHESNLRWNIRDKNVLLSNKDSTILWVENNSNTPIEVSAKMNNCALGSATINISKSNNNYVPYRQIVYIPSAQVLFYPFDSNYCFKWYRFGTDPAFTELVGNIQSYIIPSSEYSISKYHYYVKVSKSESCDTCATICWFNYPGLGVLGRSEEPAPGIDQQLNIYPNPSSGSFVLEMYNRATRTYDVSIRDIQGRLHFRDKWTAIPGTSTLRPEHVLGRWPSGLYLVSLSDGLHEPIIQKIVVE